MIPQSRPQEILLPVNPWFMGFTVALAFMVNLLPWGGLALTLRPDLAALVLLFWSVREPRKLGFTAAWILGLGMDIADASLFGQHALAYSLLVFAGIALNRRFRMFGFLGQILHVVPLLIGADLVVLLVRIVAGGEFPGWSYFGGSLIAAALWPLISILFRLPQMPKSDPDSGVNV